MGVLKSPEPQIVEVAAKKLIGCSLRMSMAQNRLAELWKSFRPYATEIANRVNADFVSMALYDSPDYFSAFSMERKFTRWAAVEVSEFAAMPTELEKHTLQGGLYAMFEYRGRPMDFAQAANHIYQVWLPASAFALDNREHFEILGPGYRPDDPDAEETIWIPVCRR